MLKKWILVAAMAAIAAGVLFAGGMVGGVLSGAVPALGQEEPVEEPPCGLWPGLGMRHGGFFGWGDGSWTLFDAAAEALGLTPEGLFTESHAGKSLTEIAEEKGVDIEVVRDAMQAARGEGMREAIAQAVEDGKLSQEQANWLLQGLDQGFFPRGRGLGFGRGHGFGGRMGFWQEQ